MVTNQNISLKIKWHRKWCRKAKWWNTVTAEWMQHEKKNLTFPFYEVFKAASCTITLTALTFNHGASHLQDEWDEQSSGSHCRLIKCDPGEFQCAAGILQSMSTGITLWCRSWITLGWLIYRGFLKVRQQGKNTYCCRLLPFLLNCMFAPWNKNLISEVSEVLHVFTAMIRSFKFL